MKKGVMMILDHLDENIKAMCFINKYQSAFPIEPALVLLQKVDLMILKKLYTLAQKMQYHRTTVLETNLLSLFCSTVFVFKSLSTLKLFHPFIQIFPSKLFNTTTSYRKQLIEL